MPKLSKRRKQNLEVVPKEPVPLNDAVAVLKKFKGPKFDQAVEIAMHLGIDPRRADQIIRGSISLPKGIGKSKRVIAFCGADDAAAALAAGAIAAGADELVAKVNDGWLDFDVAVATPDMMRVVGRLGRVLGPRGLMPSPKAGTVTKDVAAAVREHSAGMVQYRNDDNGNIHAAVGRMSFSEADLMENISFFIGMIEKAKPSAAKGNYIKKIVLSGTMTPGVQVAH